MLTLDLLRYRIQEDEVCVRHLNPENKKYRAIARNLIEIYGAHLNKTKESLASALAAYEAADTNYHVTRGLAKLLEDRSEFTIQSPIDSEVLQEKIFAYASKRHPVVTKRDRLHRHTHPKTLAKIATVPPKISETFPAKCYFLKRGLSPKQYWRRSRRVRLWRGNM